MSIKIDSTTDSAEAVSAALGDLAKAEKVEETPAAVKAAEKKDASGASEEVEGEAESKETKESEEADKPKKKNGFKKRIERLNKKLSEKDQQIAYWQNEVQRRTQSQETPKPADKKVESSDRPKADAFESHDDYLEALADWKADQKIQKLETKRREEDVKSHQQKRVDRYVEQVKAFEKENKDFKEVMEDVNDVPMSLAVQEAILGSDKGPELAYNLAKDREFFEKVCQMPPLEAARAIGRFEAALEKADSLPPAKKTTDAPKPIKTVSKSTAVSTKDPGEMDYQEFKKWREAQLRGA
jgi:hypothetical protein